jgi:hypothetical protein
MYKSSLDVGYDPGDSARFEILKSISFSSVLDVGSGPCRLHPWLISNGIVADYEAMDIRSEALSHCKCKTYDSLPVDKRYDLVVLFGVADYGTPDIILEKKKNFHNLVMLASKLTSNMLIFSVVKDVYKSSQLVTFSNEEVNSLAKLISKNYTIYESADATEYVVKVEIYKSIIIA